MIEFDLMPYYVNLNPQTSEKAFGNSFFKWFIKYGKYYLLLFNILLFLLYLERMYLTGQNFLKRKSIEKTLSEIEVLAPNAKRYDNFQKIAKTIEDVNNANFSIPLTLALFQQNTPEGVYIQSMSIIGRNLVFSAISKTSSDFSVFLEFLIKDDSFEKVLLTSSEFDEVAGFYTNRFEIIKK